jgi:ornithine decarboxylase
LTCWVRSDCGARGRNSSDVVGYPDIGGGFEDDNFELIAAVLRDAIAEHFPLNAQGDGVRIIAEPGRYYVSRAFQLATNIIARRAAREGTNDESSMMEGMEMDDDAEQKPSVMCRFFCDIAFVFASDLTLLSYRADYINDGVYGAFNCTLFDHQIVHPVVMTLSDVFQTSSDYTSTEECSVWGASSPPCVEEQSVRTDEVSSIRPHLRLH